MFYCVISPTLNIIFRKLGSVIEKSIGIDNFYVALVNRELDLITFPYYQDIKDHSPKEKFSSGKGMTNHAIKKNKQIPIFEILAYNSWLPFFTLFSLLFGVW